MLRSLCCFLVLLFFNFTSSSSQEGGIVFSENNISHRVQIQEKERKSAVFSIRNEKRILPPTQVTVDATEVSLEEGEELSFCVNISAPLVEDLTVVVSVHGNNSPHFSSFTTEEIYFSANGSLQECIVIPSVYSESTEDYYFTINIQSPPNEVVIGENSTTLVTVNEVDLTSICNWAGPDVVICQGGEGVVIGYDISEEGDNPACWNNESYCVKWLPQEGLDEPGSLMPVANPNQTTTYTIYVSDDDGNFYGEDEVTVEVLAMPVPQIFPTTPVLCGEESLTIYTSIAGDDNGYSFHWSDPENASGSILSISEPGTYAVTVMDLATECSRTSSVTVTELDMVAGINANANEICAGGELTLLAEVEGADGPFVYLWSNGEVSPGLNITEPNTYEVTITDTESGCEAFASIDIPPYEIEVEILGAAANPDNALEDLEGLEDNQVICTGQSFNLG